MKFYKEQENESITNKEGKSIEKKPIAKNGAEKVERKLVRIGEIVNQAVEEMIDRLSVIGEENSSNTFQGMGSLR